MGKSFSYIGTIRSMDNSEKTVTGKTIRELATALGIGYITVMKIINEDPTCSTRRWVTIEKVEETTKRVYTKKKKVMS